MRVTPAGCSAQCLSLRRRLFIVILLLCWIGCYRDVGTAGVILRLNVLIVAADGHPRQHLQIWYTDHGLPWQSWHAQPQEPICTTSASGACSARIAYIYTTYDYPWNPPNGERSRYTSANRFELSTREDGKRLSLGFLPPLSTEYLSGYREINYRAVQ
jgi:hypothetical protein